VKGDKNLTTSKIPTSSNKRLEKHPKTKKEESKSKEESAIQVGREYEGERLESWRAWSAKRINPKSRGRHKGYYALKGKYTTSSVTSTKIKIETDT